MRTMSQRRKYTKEFKDNAVSLVLSGRAALEVSHDLGIDISTLNRWKKLYLDEQDIKHDGLGESPSALAAENGESEWGHISIIDKIRSHLDN